MASTAAATEQSSPPSLEELARRSVITTLLPLIIDYVSSGTPSERPREVSVVVNPRTGSLTLVEGSAGKDGLVPASKASIDAIPVVKVLEEGLDCAICLAEFEVGEEAKQMPCKHKYHTGCIDKWLVIQGSCPVCRYRMPVDEEERDKKVGGGNGSDGEAEESGGGVGGIPILVFQIYFAPRLRSRRNTESGEGLESEDDNSGSTRDADGPSSTQDAEVDSGSSSQEMDIDRSTL